MLGLFRRYLLIRVERIKLHQLSFWAVHGAGKLYGLHGLPIGHLLCLHRRYHIRSMCGMPGWFLRPILWRIDLWELLDGALFSFSGDGMLELRSWFLPEWHRLYELRSMRCRPLCYHHWCPVFDCLLWLRPWFLLSASGICVLTLRARILCIGIIIAHLLFIVRRGHLLCGRRYFLVLIIFYDKM